MFDIILKALAAVGAVYIVARVAGPLFWLFWRCDEYQIMVNKMYYHFQQEEMRKAREGKQK